MKKSKNAVAVGALGVLVLTGCGWDGKARVDEKFVRPAYSKTVMVMVGKVSVPQKRHYKAQPTIEVEYGDDVEQKVKVTQACYDKVEIGDMVTYDYLKDEC